MDFRTLKSTPKKFFQEMFSTGGGRRRNFLRSYHTEIVRFWPLFLPQFFFKKTWKFPNKKGTFDVNLVFTATLACTKRDFSSQKRALLILWKNLGLWFLRPWSCNHLVTRLMRPTEELQTIRSNKSVCFYEQPVLVLLEQLVASLLGAVRPRCRKKHRDYK